MADRAKTVAHALRAGTRPKPRRWVERGLAAAVSVAAHLGTLAAILLGRPPPAVIEEPPPVIVSLVEAPKPEPEPKPPGDAKPAPPAPPSPPSPVRARPKAAASSIVLRPTARPSRIEPLPAPARATPAAAPSLSEGELAMAATAGSGPGGGAGGGGGGGSCNMIRRLEAALREDPEVQAAVAKAGPAAGRTGKAFHVWNGDWMRSPGEDGEGLAVVRQAIMVEVAFAPAACRADPVRGLVLISLADGPGSARLVMGGGAWRWSDVLNPSWRR